MLFENYMSLYQDLILDHYRNPRNFGTLDHATNTGEVKSLSCGDKLTMEIVVKGDIGHMSAFMAQSGTLVVCGDAGDALGDSIYETHIYVRGSVKGLGADCIEKELKDFHREELGRLLEVAGADAKVDEFKRYGSARQLYNFNIDNAGAY